jgi:uncharacterized protein (DUF2132 family)
VTPVLKSALVFLEKGEKKRKDVQKLNVSLVVQEGMEGSEDEGKERRARDIPTYFFFNFSLGTMRVRASVVTRPDAGERASRYCTFG